MLRCLLFASVFCAAMPCVAPAVTCAPDEYIVKDDECSTCPASATCDGTDFVCVDGFYKNGSICTPCSVSSSTCTSADDYSCLPGFYDNNGKCSACPENAICAGGHEFFYCQDGYYKHVYGTNISCLSCAGHTCDGEKLISCDDGYWFYAPQGCLTCATVAHSYCLNDKMFCMEGYYFNGGRCWACDKANYCPRGESNKDNKTRYCAAGYYRAGGECIPCGDGVVCPGGKIPEIVCPSALYRHDDGRCLPYAPGDCGAAPDCNPGCYNNDGICAACGAEHSTCTSADDFACMAGYYKNGDTCTVCPANSSCPAGSEQIVCIDGYYPDGGVCTICPYSSYCNNNVKYVCPDDFPALFDRPVPDGITYLRASGWGGSTGKTSINECVKYRVFFAEAGGEFLLANLSFTGSHYVLNIASYMRYYYSANTGYYLNSTKNLNGTIYYAGILPCTNGPDNSYYTDSGTPNGNDCPWRCSDGYYRDANICKVCPAGLDCLGGQIVCAPGLYADGDHCSPCPAGYGDNPNRGAGDINGCQIKCPGGSYIASAGAQTCENVGAGYWNADNYTNYGASGVRNACPAGLTTAGYGAGADEAGDCGRILNIGPYYIYMRTDKKTPHALLVYDGVRTYYGNAGTYGTGHVHIKQSDGTLFSVYDDITAGK